MKKIRLLLLALCIIKSADSQNGWYSNEGKLLNTRAFAGSVSVNNKIYIVGGVVNPFSSSNMDTDIVEEYDPLTKISVEKLGKLPTKRHSFGIATNNKNLIYCIGGADMNSNYHAELEVYNTEKDEWTKLANMPTARQQVCAALIGDSLYVVGGDNGAQNRVTRYCFEVYIVSQNRWVKKSGIPTPVRNGCAVTYMSKVYVIGGHISDPVNLVLEYDPQTGLWTKKSNMPTPRTDLSVEVLDGKIYAIGGHPGLPTVEEYDPLTDSWKKRSNMSSGRCFQSSAVANNRIYILGGLSTQHSNQPSNFKSIESFTPNVTTGSSRDMNTSMGIMLFPNPCTDCIQIAGGHTINDYAIVDRNGALLVSEDMDDKSSRLIDTKLFSPGIYLLIVNQGKTEQTYRFCKR